MDDALLAIADLGLADGRLGSVDRRARAALEREFAGARSPRRLRVPKPIAIALAAVLTASAGAVAYAALSHPEKLSDGVACHDSASGDGGGAMVSLDGRSALETCRSLWTSGQLGRRAAGTAPELQVCVDPGGGAAIHVYPSADGNLCVRFGMKQDQTAGAEPDAQRYGKFSAVVLARLNRTACPTAAQVHAWVDDALSEASLSGWTVKETGGSYTPDVACASLSLDSDARIATIAPVPTSR